MIGLLERIEKRCEVNWKDLKETASEFAELMAALCSLMFWMVLVKSVFVCRNRPFICSNYRWPLQSKCVGWIVCTGIALVFCVIYVVMMFILDWLLSSLLWPKFSMGGADVLTKTLTKTAFLQQLSALDQLFKYEAWLNIGYYALSLIASFLIVVWGVSNIQCIKYSVCEVFSPPKAIIDHK